MKALAIIVVVALASAILIGCGGGSPQPAAKSPAPNKPPGDSAAKPAADKPAEKPESRAVRRERPAAEKAKVGQLFQVPQVIRVANNPNDSRQDGPRAIPQIRLLGFSRIGGVQKALVQVKNEVLAIEQGDIVDGAELVAMDAEGVSFQFASGQRLPMRLFEKQETQPVVLARASTPAIAAELPGGMKPAANKNLNPN